MGPAGGWTPSDHELGRREVRRRQRRRSLLVSTGTTVVVLGLLLLGLLVRRGGAGASASVFFLMPPVTAVLAWVLLDERLTGLAVLGLALSTVGVAVATRRRA